MTEVSSGSVLCRVFLYGFRHHFHRLDVMYSFVTGTLIPGTVQSMASRGMSIRGTSSFAVEPPSRPVGLSVREWRSLGREMRDMDPIHMQHVTLIRKPRN